MAARMALPIASSIGSNLASAFGIGQDSEGSFAAAAKAAVRKGQDLPQGGKSFVEGLRSALQQIDDDAAEEFDEILEDNGIGADGTAEAIDALKQLVSGKELSESEAFLALRAIA